MKMQNYTHRLSRVYSGKSLVLLVAILLITHALQAGFIPQQGRIFSEMYIPEGNSSAAKEAGAGRPAPDRVIGSFTEVSPNDSVFVTPSNEDFWVIAAAPADIDADGDLDIAVFGYYVVYNESVDYRLVMMLNNGSAGADQWSFAYHSVFIGELTSGSSDLSWGDADGDGDLDLALGTNDTMVIFRNDNGNLVLTDTQLPGYWEDNSQADFDLRSVTWADFDNDGDQDLLIPSVYSTDSFSFRTALMRNDGPNGTGGWIFTETDTVFASTVHAQSAWADVDGDQDLDLFLINIDPFYDEGFIRIYTNTSNGQFTGEDVLNGLLIEHGEAQWGDYDSDGDLDILIAGHLRETDGSYTWVALRIYVNNNGLFSETEVLADLPGEEWVDITAATWADYDSDGDMDILVAGNYNSGTNIEGRARIYVNDNGVYSNSGIELPAPHASGNRGGTFSWLDIDMDGDLDYFIAGQYFVPGGNGLVESQMHLYRNDTPGQNNAPSPPSNLIAEALSASSVLLSWDSGNDDSTPSDALTYQLELYHDNLPVNLPASLPQPGNVSAVNNWLISGLETGNYQWTLISLDAAFSASELISGSFSMGAVGVEEIHANQQNQYILKQNYPNPFSGATRIEYILSEANDVSMKVYNLVGEEVAVLVDSQQDAGSYHIVFDAAALPAGIYFYQFSAGDKFDLRKMIVSK